MCFSKMLRKPLEVGMQGSSTSLEAVCFIKCSKLPGILDNCGPGQLPQLTSEGCGSANVDFLHLFSVAKIHSFIRYHSLLSAMEENLALDDLFIHVCSCYLCDGV